MSRKYQFKNTEGLYFGLILCEPKIDVKSASVRVLKHSTLFSEKKYHLAISTSSDNIAIE
jgi:hypothetical protein